jgi:hypothetical protein
MRRKAGRGEKVEKEYRRKRKEGRFRLKETRARGEGWSRF